jgi:hypothetical protein
MLSLGSTVSSIVHSVRTIASLYPQENLAPANAHRCGMTRLRRLAGCGKGILA